MILPKSLILAFTVPPIKGIVSHWISYKILRVIHLNGGCTSEHQEINGIIKILGVMSPFSLMCQLLSQSSLGHSTQPCSCSRMSGFRFFKVAHIQGGKKSICLQNQKAISFFKDKNARKLAHIMCFLLVRKESIFWPMILYKLFTNCPLD